MVKREITREEAKELASKVGASERERLTDDIPDRVDPRVIKYIPWQGVNWLIHSMALFFTLFFTAIAFLRFGFFIWLFFFVGISLLYFLLVIILTRHYFDNFSFLLNGTSMTINISWIGKWRTRRMIPYSTMESVSISQGRYDRKYGLCTLNTRGTIIHGLTETEAAVIADVILRRRSSFIHKGKVIEIDERDRLRREIVSELQAIRRLLEDREK